MKKHFKLLISLSVILCLLSLSMVNFLNAFATGNASDTNIDSENLEEFVTTDDSEIIPEETTLTEYAESVSAFASNSETKIYFVTNEYTNDIIILNNGDKFAMVDVGGDNDYPDGSDPRYPYRPEVLVGCGTEELTLSFLKDLGVKELEFVVLTHAHDDHAGAFDEILAQVPVKTLYMKPYDEKYISGVKWDAQYVYDTAIAAAKAHNVNIIQNFNSTNTKFSFGSATIQLFNWETDLDSNGNPKVVPDENYNSLGVKITQGSKSAFLSGDIQNADGDESRLAPSIGHVDIFETGHHSVTGANSYNYVMTLSPKYVISTGGRTRCQTDLQRAITDLGSEFCSIFQATRAVVATLKDSSVSVSLWNETGWTCDPNSINTIWYYYENGSKVSGWKDIGKYTYYFSPSTKVMQTGWLKLNGNTYFLRNDTDNENCGSLVKGTSVVINGKTYTFNSNGALISGDATNVASISNVKISNVTSSGYTITCTIDNPSAVTGIYFPTWTTKDGQDDIIWHPGSINGTTASCTIKTGQHNNETGEYNTHIYAYKGDVQLAFAATSLEVPKASSNNNTSSAITCTDFKLTDVTSSGYTVTCTFTGKDNVKAIYFPTWTDKNGQDDIIWYEGNISGSTATYKVKTSNHNNESGLYNTHAYALNNSDELVGLGTNSTTVPASTSNETISATDFKFSDVTSNGYTVTCTFTGKSNIESIYFPTWTDKNGQDDIIWHTASISGNTATYKVKTSDHNNETGLYNTHAYAENSSGELIVLACDNVTVPAASNNNSEDISCTNFKISDVTSNGYTVTCTFTGKSNIKDIYFPTWTDKNGQDDIIWYTGNISGNTATCKVKTSNHNNETGLYYTHAYASDKSDNLIVLSGDSVNIASSSSNNNSSVATLKDISTFNVNSNGYTIICEFDNMANISEVLLPTWSDKNGQDDVIWHKASISGNKAIFTVYTRDHNNDKGLYYTHVYAYDKAGNATLMGGKDINVPK